ncbi:putative amidase C869.01 [Phalaenopsis equestris]|uniref:putative amidase C869.01 n=1 Tax=Phalaenopsis equestris TaxID=78828 RepID=UPI0009E4A956|nr:putative amidase C869.01 [Phalaenopsis equestris]XP_020591427.1 putative amidase C869.01 [Phalaenopsis equestris]
MFKSGEKTALHAEFKLSINVYLSELEISPIRSLADAIDFNNKHSAEERIAEYGQDIFLAAQKTNGMGIVEKKILKRLAEYSANGLEKLMRENKLDGFVTPNSLAASILSIGGYPGIVVPAGYTNHGVPLGICFGGSKGFEPKLIEIA